MKIFGNIFVVLIGLGILFMYRFVSQSVSRYDAFLAALVSPVFLVSFFVVFAAITWTGKLDFLGWPRPLQYLGVAIAALSLTVVMGLSAALRGGGSHDFPWSVQPFCPWAAVLVPLAVALVGALWLNSDSFVFAEKPIRGAFGVMITLSLLSNIVFAVEVRRNVQRKAEEQARNDFAIVQQTEATNDFSRLLHYTSRFERPATRQLALQKILATGPQFNALMIECLKTPVFEEGLTYLRDNDPPGDAGPLAVPARDAIFLSGSRVRQEIETGRAVDADWIEPRVDSVLMVADKFSKYGVDLLPAVRDFRAALNAPKQSKVPRSSVQKMDTWLASKPK